MAQALCSGTGSAEVPGLDQSYLERFVGLPIRQGKRDVDVFRFPARRDRVAIQQMEIASKRAHNEQLCAYCVLKRQSGSHRVLARDGSYRLKFGGEGGIRTRVRLLT